MKNIFKVLSLTVLLVVLISSCKKKEVVGPQGPAGPSGSNGNANVTNTTFTVTNWTATGYAYASDYLSVPSLDSTVFVSGLVMVYMQGSSTFHALPYNDGTYTVIQELGVHFLKIYVYRNDYAYFPNPSGSDAIFRIVTIPPGIKKQYPNVNYNNFAEVKHKLKLLD